MLDLPEEIVAQNGGNGKGVGKKSRVTKRPRHNLLIISSMCICIAQLSIRQYPLFRIFDGYQRVSSVEMNASVSVTQRGDDDSKVAILEDFDMSARANCGAHKCFFRSKTNSSIGFLVASNLVYTEDMFEQWNRTKRLETKYKIRHFLVEPPQRANITPRFAKRLDLISSRRHVKMYTADTPIVVQKSKVFPRRGIHFGCADSHLNKGMRNLLHGSFVNSIEVDAFLERLRRDLEHIVDLLEKEPWAAPDFQFVIDRRGRVYVTDLGWFVINLDRGVEKTSWSKQSFQEEWKGKCHRVVRGLLRGFTASWNTTVSRSSEKRLA